MLLKRNIKEDIPYPAESQENNKLLESSSLDCSLSQKSINSNSAGDYFISTQPMEYPQPAVGFEDYIVNEELVLSLSQAAINESACMLL